WLRFTPESTKPMVTPAPRRPAPRAPAALIRTRCSLRLGSAKLTGAPRPGTDGGFTWVSEVSVGTVGVKSGPVPPGTTGGGGVARTLPPPPPQAARPRAMAQARAESAQGFERRSGLDMVRTPARHPPPRNRCAPLAHYANSSASAADAIIAACGQGRHKPNGVSMSDVVIVGAKRTAIGSLLGQFTGVPTPTLGSTAIRGALEHAGLAADQVDEVIMGCVLPAGLGQAPARQAALGAGIPPAAGCTTINKVCGSGMKAVMLAHDAIKAGSARVVVAGGMES